ncbi:MAG: alpha/beta fold hydrolase [Polyangiaceae bacterium]
MVTLHGGLGLDHTYFRPGLDPLGDSFGLVHFDQRGCGRSTTTRPMQDVTHETWAADVDALRESLGHEKIVLFGHSYGAFIALEYALRYGHRLSGLILCEVAPVIDYPDVIIGNARAQAPNPAVFERVLSTFGKPAADDDDMKQTWADIVPLYFHDFNRRTADAMNDRIQFRAAAFNQSTCVCLPKFNVLNRLSEIRVPTLILAGRHDWVLTVAEGANRVHEGIKDSELVIFERTGHFPFIEEQGSFLAAVRGFQGKRLGPA